MVVTLVVFISVLGLLILVHEAGHFISAKRVGIRVEEFGFGLPPRVWRKKIGETIYSFNLLPIGGFVKLTGEDEVESDDPASFASKSSAQKGLVLASGVLLNFLLAVLIFSVIFTIGVPTPVRVTIEDIAPQSPAETVGLKKGDRVLAIDEVLVSYGLTLVSYIKKHLGESIVLKILRGEETFELKVVPRSKFPKDQGPLGVVIRTHFEKKSYPVWQAPFVGTGEALGLTWMMLRGLSTMFWDLVLRGIVPKDVAGPVGVAQLTGEAMSFGKLAVFQLLGFLSLNLALINALPFPALDGGRLLFVGFEAVTGKRAHPKFQKWVHTVGLAFLLILIVLVTIQDVSRILTAQSFFDSVKAALPNK